ncbi:Uncharacterised protein [Mycobacteroides abscessus subsp. abscessus]|nr:Uncharacterised protein [Mycobacteroides abscessus subsp. abscessus]
MIAVPSPFPRQSLSTATPSTYPVRRARSWYSSRRCTTAAWAMSMPWYQMSACIPPRQCSQSSSVKSPSNASMSNSRAAQRVSLSRSAV